MTDDTSKFLIQAKNNMEADFIISVLESNDIVAYKQYETTGSYLNIATGYNFQGTNVFVSDECLEDAKAIVDELVFEKSEEEKKNNEEWGTEENYINKRRNLVRLMLWMIIIPVIIIIVIQMKEIL